MIALLYKHNFFIVKIYFPIWYQLNQLIIFNNKILYFNSIFAWFNPMAFIQFVEKSFITAMDMEIDSWYGKWLVPDRLVLYTYIYHGVYWYETHWIRMSPPVLEPRLAQLILPWQCSNFPPMFSICQDGLDSDTAISYEFLVRVRIFGPCKHTGPYRRVFFRIT